MLGLLYPAQEYFPDPCKECPRLVGYIEDGEISLDEVTESEVQDKLAEDIGLTSLESCTGPREVFAEELGGIAIECTLNQTKEL